MSDVDGREFITFDLETHGNKMLQSLLKLCVLCTKQRTNEKLVQIKQKIDTYKSTLARLPVQEIVGKEKLQNYIDVALNKTM